MLHTSRSAARRAWLPIALVAAVACKQGPTPEVQARLDSLNLVAQQRERMVQELADQSRFLSEISAELAKVRAPIKQLRVSRESPLRASRDSLIQRVRFITEKVNASEDRKSTRLNSSHGYISYAVFCLKKKKKKQLHR